MPARGVLRSPSSDLRDRESSRQWVTRIGVYDEICLGAARIEFQPMIYSNAPFANQALPPRRATLIGAGDRADERDIGRSCARSVVANAGSHLATTR